MESNRTFIRISPYCLAVVPQARAEKQKAMGCGRNCTPACGQIDPLRGFYEVRRLGVGNIDELLRIAVGERKPRTLNLHQDTVTATESVVNVLHYEVDLLDFAGREGFGLCKAAAEFPAKRFAPHKLLMSTHRKRGRTNVGSRFVFLFGFGLVEFAVSIVGRIHIDQLHIPIESVPVVETKSLGEIGPAMVTSSCSTGVS